MAKKKTVKKQKKSNSTLYYLIAAVIIIVALAFYFYSAPKQVGEYTKLGTPSTHEPGKVKIIEFMKFDCIHCYNLHKNFPQLLNKTKYVGKIEITYIPIVWDGQSTKSIEAYIIANQSGKGDEMQDAIFEAQANGKDVMESLIALEDIASQIGLGPDFNTKLESGFAKNEALQNIDLMNKYAGLMKVLNIPFGTPAIIMDGNLLVKQDISNMELVIDSLLK
jgi:thiol:disulfide interchange protein DsbA